MTNPDVPDRWFVTLGGRIAPATEHTFDPVSLIVTERADTAGLGLEEAAIVQRCARPVAVVELASHLQLPLGAVAVLLSRLLDEQRISARHPHTSPATADASSDQVDMATVERVLVGLRNL